MTSYKPVKDRFEVFERSNGEVFLLLEEPFCKRCADPIQEEYAGHGLCYACYEGDTRVDGYNLSKVYAASIYIKKSRGHNLSKEIKEFKRNPEYGEGLSEILEHCIAEKYPELQNYELMVAPPSGDGERDQMDELLKILSQDVELPYRPILERSEDYSSQKELSDKGDRIENVEDKIRCTENLNGEDVIVIDDVYTTGATMYNSAKALREKGAGTVIGLVLGRDGSLSHFEFAGILEETEGEDEG